MPRKADTIKPAPPEAPPSAAPVTAPNPDADTALLDHLRAGQRFPVACRLADLDVESLRQRRRDDPAFATACLKAEAEWEAACWLKVSASDAKWALERKYPKTYQKAPAAALVDDKAGDTGPSHPGGELVLHLIVNPDHHPPPEGAEEEHIA